ncbi:GNAT family N-acetyltransferase [uncultured Cohaesibacter sp.]|uniref:GNAT family N-acetyltransferase n=1 Tax=uncultured Cohaesibacter sp. TaxID=1002546 RepID=UPI0029311995|nr:GNAT family N-acetyltransferase [uncultured Cohaesibacter sp.]
MSNFTLSTARLKIRSWRQSDSEPYASINADPRVREFLGDPLTRLQSDAQIREFDRHERRHGFTFWAMEIPNVKPCIGFVGLQRTDYESHFTPAIEIGWRLDPSCWGHGYATEGASAVLRHAFEKLGLEEVVAVTVPQNVKSQSVMKRLGMTYSPEDDFDHPEEETGHPLQRSVLYRIRRDQFVTKIVRSR